MNTLQILDNPRIRTLKRIHLLFFFVILHGVTNAQTLYDYYFEQITTTHGLSQNYITCIQQDSQGFIWIGTTNGVNKYDGYRMREYYSIPNDIHSLKGNYISTIYNDSSERLWIGTNNGVCCYQPQTDNFEHVDLEQLSGYSPANRHVTALFEDQNQTLWIGTAGGMLYAYLPKEKQLESYITIRQDPIRTVTSYRDSLLIGCSKLGLMHLDTKSKQMYQTSLDSLHTHVSIISFLNASNGELWIGSKEKGLLKYGEASPVITIKDIQSLCAISDTRIMIATENSGLLEYNTQTGNSTTIGTVNNKNLNSDAVTCLYKDRTNILWVGTTNGGINKFDPNRNLFKYIPILSKDLSHNSIQSVLTLSKQGEQKLLVGIDNKGLYIYDKTTNKIAPHEANERFTGLKDTPINSSLYDSRGFTWIGTYDKSLKILGPEPERSHIERLIRQKLSSSTTIKFILEDKKRHIWIATSQGKIFRYTPGKQILEEFYRTFNNQLNPNNILSLYEDCEGRIWAGSICGLFCYEEFSNEFQLICQPDQENPYADKNKIAPIRFINETLWLGTYNGIIKYTLQSGEIQHYTTNDGLPGNLIKGLLYDQDNNHLWISTDKGLSCLNLDDERFTNFGPEDGILNREFNNMSFLHDQDGKFFFGCVNGIYHFDPKQISVNPNLPKVIITDCQFYNNDQEEKIEKTHYLPVTGKNEIRISPENSVFSLHYVALNYTNTEKNQYAYRLKNYDSQWRFVGQQRNVMFTNLDPGTYYFQVIASNNDGIWDEYGSTLKIVILPPWWRTVWAYAIYIIIIIYTFYLITRFYTNRIKMRNLLANEQFERKQLEKLNSLKIQFFSNITHEFRTPLTLILSPVNSILNKNVGKAMQHEYLKIIQNNGLKLLGLVNELLDFSKSEAGFFTFSPVCSDLSAILKNEIQPFYPLAKEKRINLQFDYDEEALICQADSVIIQKIVSNLLSNAIKHTPENGQIILSLRKDKEETNSKIYISIKDSGKGIPKDQQEFIFERFYQIKQDITAGTGIGLALVKKLVSLHQGNIKVESEIGKGSLFIVEIPYIESVESDKQQIKTLVEKESLSVPSNGINEKKQDEEAAVKHHTILIAEDNKELRIYIASLLSNAYNILTAENGKEALEIAQKEQPDVILSDILMQEMDGREFCKHIKQNVNTCHIPFIMLTALASDMNQVEGLDAGADDYLTKPFNPSILQSKIVNILQSRILISRRNNTLQALQPEKVIVEDKDNQFLLHLIGIIKENLSNSDLKIDDLGKELGMSHTPFYKKIKQLTNQTPNDFLKNIRLEQAKKLLSDSDLTVSEIAYRCGFNSPKYFRECFKRHFGESPSEYQEHQIERSS